MKKVKSSALSSLSRRLRSRLSGHHLKSDATSSSDSIASQGTDLVDVMSSNNTPSHSLGLPSSHALPKRTRERLLSQSRQHSDNGRSNSIHVSAKMTTGAGTVAYMAPELCGREAMRNDAVKYSQSVDVFAFGVICWEALELDRAWKDEKWPARIMDKVSEGKRLPIREKYDMPPPDGYMEVMTCSWDQEPHLRPTFSALSMEMERIEIAEGKARGSGVDFDLNFIHRIQLLGFEVY